MVGLWNVQGKCAQVQLLSRSSLPLHTGLPLLLLGATAWEPEQQVPARMTDVPLSLFLHLSPLNLTLNSALLAASNGAAEHLGKNVGCVSKKSGTSWETVCFFLKKGSLSSYIRLSSPHWELFQLQLERFLRLLRVSGKGFGISWLANPYWRISG